MKCSLLHNLEKLANAGLKLESFGQNSHCPRASLGLYGQEQETIEEMIDFCLRKRPSIGMFREAQRL